MKASLTPPATIPRLPCGNTQGSRALRKVSSSAGWRGPSRTARARPSLWAPILSHQLLRWARPWFLPLGVTDTCQYPECSWALPPSQQHLGAQVSGMGKEDLCWFPPALKCSTLRMNESETLRLFIYPNFFVLQIGYIFKACHPQTFWNTKMSGMLCLIWNHLKGQIICPLISQVARVDIFGSFYLSDLSSILFKSDQIRIVFG